MKLESSNALELYSKAREAASPDGDKLFIALLSLCVKADAPSIVMIDWTSLDYHERTGSGTIKAIQKFPSFHRDEWCQYSPRYHKSGMASKTPSESKFCAVRGCYLRLLVQVRYKSAKI